MTIWIFFCCFCFYCYNYLLIYFNFYHCITAFQAIQSENGNIVYKFVSKQMKTYKRNVSDVLLQSISHAKHNNKYSKKSKDDEGTTKSRSFSLLVEEITQ